MTRRNKLQRLSVMMAKSTANEAAEWGSHDKAAIVSTGDETAHSKFGRRLRYACVVVVVTRPLNYCDKGRDMGRVFG